MNSKLDPILTEIRAVREAYAERFAGDLKALLDDIRARQAKSGRQVVARAPKRLTIVEERRSSKGNQH
jgi:hypothetical protein